MLYVICTCAVEVFQGEDFESGSAHATVAIVRVDTDVVAPSIVVLALVEKNDLT